MDESVDAETKDGDSPLVQLFESPGRTRIVEAFLGKQGTELTAAEVSKLAGVDRSTVSRNVDILVDIGLVKQRETASAGVRYWAERDDPTIQALFDVRRALFEVLVENPELVERNADDDPTTEVYVDRAGLVRLFESPGRAKIIEAFLSAQEEELMGAKIADLAEVSRSTVSRNIDELVDLRVVERTRRIGGSKLYRFATDGPIGDAVMRARWELLIHTDERDPSQEIDSTSAEPDSPEEFSPGPPSTVTPTPMAGLTGGEGVNPKNPEELHQIATELEFELRSTKEQLDDIEFKFRKKITEAVELSGIESDRTKREASQIRKRYEYLRLRYEAMLRQYVFISIVKNARTHLDVKNTAALQDLGRRATVRLKQEVVTEIQQLDDFGGRADRHEDLVSGAIEVLTSEEFEAADSTVIDDLVRQVKQGQLDPSEISLTDVGEGKQDTVSEGLY